MAKTNYNGTATALGSLSVAPEHNGRRSLFFQNLSETEPMVLNFGTAASATDILTVLPQGSMFFDKTTPYEIEKEIFVYCGAAEAFEAQAEE